VTVPVEHLRATPGTQPRAGVHDPEQETQLLYGERARLLKTQDAWAYVEAVEQPEFTHASRWQGYPGWLPLVSLQPSPSAPPPTAVVTTKWATVWTDRTATRAGLRLPMGSRLSVLSTDGSLWPVRLLSGASGWTSSGDVKLLRELRRLPVADRRQEVLRAAYAFLGDPYFWGGRSPYSPSPAAAVNGVDCSGLVNLSYRAAGLEIPRDAHEQSLRARRVATLQPADLIFLSDPDQPQRISHVMLYLGDGWLIEGPGTGLAVRRIEVVKRLGLSIEQLRPGVQVDRRTVHFGSYFP
jgi:cell wall-associated NlpC family hydrolase